MISILSSNGLETVSSEFAVVINNTCDKSNGTSI